MKNILIIAKYTFKEMVKSKIFLVTSAVACLIVLATYVASEFTYGVPEKVALDFGLGMLSLSSGAIAIFMGATLLPGEIDSRTVYMVISRPVSRTSFITGKILGMISVLFLNITVLSFVSLLSAHFMGGDLNQVIYMAVIFNFLENILLLMLVVFLSLFTNNILASSISASLFLLGHAVKEVQSTTFVAKREFVQYILKFYHFILPGFYKLNFKDFVIYQKTIEGNYLFTAFFYGVFYSLFLYLMIVFVFNRKNLD